MMLPPEIKTPNPPMSMPLSDPPDLTLAPIKEDPPRKLSCKEAAEEKDGLNYENDDSTMNYESLQLADRGSEEDPILLSNKEKQRLYNPWKRSVIIKSVGRKPNHQYLYSKPMDLGKLQESIILIDLGDDFYIVKLALEESQKRILLEGPWFVASSYISTRVWELNFVPVDQKSHLQQSS
ncbi:hypothetical protein BC332_01993 [Capsicum chinense]|nr:hypothetical protein BC332_01993 [Capsicum chinense]